MPNAQQQVFFIILLVFLLLMNLSIQYSERLRMTSNPPLITERQRNHVYCANNLENLSYIPRGGGSCDADEFGQLCCVVHQYYFPVCYGGGHLVFELRVVMMTEYVRPFFCFSLAATILLSHFIAARSLDYRTELSCEISNFASKHSQMQRTALSCAFCLLTSFGQAHHRITDMTRLLFIHIGRQSLAIPLP